MLRLEATLAYLSERQHFEEFSTRAVCRHQNHILSLEMQLSTLYSIITLALLDTCEAAALPSGETFKISLTSRSNNARRSLDGSTANVPLKDFFQGTDLQVGLKHFLSGEDIKVFYWQLHGCRHVEVQVIVNSPLR